MKFKDTILEYIKNVKDDDTMQEMAYQLGITDRTVRNAIKSLREDGTILVHRKGDNTYYGQWYEVVDNEI
jgi:predicted ArsR family transcriptional regulator